MTFKNPFPELCSFVVAEKTENLDLLHPEEIKLVESFKAPKRREDFVSGRSCAHLAQIEAGHQSSSILINEDRSPNWQNKIVGSITHSHKIAAAIVAQKEVNLLGVGVDLESLDRKIRPGVERHVLTGWEREKWTTPENPISLELRIIFSIKEAIFKCFYPQEKIYLGLHDAEVTFLKDGIFKARLVKSPWKNGELPEVEGIYQINQGEILAALYFR